MSHDEFAEELARALDARAGRSARAAAGSNTSPELRTALDAVDLIWESQQVPPPLDEDPTAIMLGLVPDPRNALDGRAAAAARKASRVSISSLVARLRDRGWDVDASAVFAWENGKPVQVVPAMITAIAEELSVDRTRLTTVASTDPVRAQFDRIFAGAAFRALAERFAQLEHTSLDIASRALESRALAAVHRGGAPDAAVLLESLDHLIAALEAGDDGRGG